MSNYIPKDQNVDYSPGEKFYTQKVASRYDELRKNDRYWIWENTVLDQCIEMIQTADKIADCPVGTGRFMDIYKKYGLRVLGMDISRDMLNEASKKVADLTLTGGVELIQADISTLTLDRPIANALVCFRLLHLISHNRLSDVINGLASIPSKYIFLQIFLVKDVNLRRTLYRVLSAVRSDKINLITKLKYLYRTIKAVIVNSLFRRQVPSFNKHEENSLCDVMYSHTLSSIITTFEQNSFTLKRCFELRDDVHLRSESGCYLSTIVVLKKESLIG